MELAPSNSVSSVAPNFESFLRAKRHAFEAPLSLYLSSLHSPQSNPLAACPIPTYEPLHLLQKQNGILDNRSTCVPNSAGSRHIRRLPTSTSKFPPVNILCCYELETMRFLRLQYGAGGMLYKTTSVIRFKCGEPGHFAIVSEHPPALREEQEWISYSIFRKRQQKSTIS